ncbi:MAG: tryptophan synthase subunit beta [Deltaproteobacteria bacterium]|nr:tryptophan synthase subunit beta [Deltaproteobacteria bacterium]
MAVEHNPIREGYFGEFGGAFIPEMLRENVVTLASRYREILAEVGFRQELDALLRDYVGRPTPLYHARRLSEDLGVTIFLKREDLCHTGSHKLNNAIGQVLLARRLGRTRIIAETGAGQHGVATATACALLNLPCVVYMGRRDMERQAPNVARMRLLGAEVRSVTSGSETLKDATNEALRDWIANPADTHYVIGSVVGPHPFPSMVAAFQSVIGAEIETQFAAATGGDVPDAIVACVGGGSNAIGGFVRFLDNAQVRLIGAEAAGEGIATPCTAATLTLGRPGVLHGARTMLLQTNDGQIVEAHSISAGLDYPGVGPQHAHLHASGRAEYVAVTDRQALDAVKLLCRTEGIIPALESAHAIAALSLARFEPGVRVVLVLSGRGDKDLATYERELATPEAE